VADQRRRVVWTDEARSALDEALSYIVQKSPQGARSVLQQALEVGASLSTMSERGRVVPEQDEPTIREVLVGRYRLLYEGGCVPTSVEKFWRSLCWPCVPRSIASCQA